MDKAVYITSNSFRVLTIIATLLALVVIILGAYTRLTDAGLGCPDWPGCYGKLFVPGATQAQLAFPNAPLQTTKAMTEMAHRYLASSLGCVILLLAGFAWHNRHIAHHLRWLPAFLLVLVIGQGMLGMWTVTLKLHPTVVMAHLLGGFTTLSLLALLTLRAHAPRIPYTQLAQTHWPRFALIGLIILALQIALGGWTSSNYAALACPDFPTCQQQWLPPLDIANAFTLWHPVGPNFEGGLLDNAARVTIHLAHRLGAVITVLYLTVFMVLLWRATREKLIHQLILVIALLLVAQISLGITNVVQLLPLSIAVFHHATAAFLLVILVALNYCLRHQR